MNKYAIIFINIHHSIQRGGNMKHFLHLANGSKFSGNLLTEASGGTFSSEIVFYTGMTGYQEIMTDPSYLNQIIVFTYPLVGNYGINEFDFESKRPVVAGVVVYEGNMKHSHYQANDSLQAYLEKWNIPLLSNVDTRAVVKNIRTDGAMEAVISPSEDFTFDCHKKKDEMDIEKVSTKEIIQYGHGAKHIILMDFGYKKSILQSLLYLDSSVTIVPYNTSYEQVKALKPDGIVLSNGPGNPKQLHYLLDNIKQIITNYPTLGISMGHQLTALALGGNTKKMLFGHHGANHPVLEIKTNKLHISSQNHGYEVDESSLEGTSLQVRFRQVNDQTVEGLIHDVLPILTIQYQPKANLKSVETIEIFEEFQQNINAFNGGRNIYA